MLIEFIKRLFFIIPSFPKTVQIGITNRCNFNCKMCQRYDLKVPVKDMDYKLFEVVLKKIKMAKNVILTGWGEPFMHPEIMRMIRLCKENGFNTRLTSNGSLLDDNKIGEILDSKLDAITFSIDSITPGKNDEGHIILNQLNIIKKLSSERIKRNSDLKIYLQSVYFLGKEENLFEIARFARENNLDRVRVSRMDIRFHETKRPNAEQEKGLIKKMQSIIGNSGLGLDFLPHTAFDGIIKKVYKAIFPFLHRGGRYCLRTFNDVYINEDGKVTPCCALPMLEMGDILKEDLKVIWKNEKFKNFRKNQKKICGKCDVLSLKPYN